VTLRCPIACSSFHTSAASLRPNGPISLGGRRLIDRDGADDCPRLIADVDVLNSHMLRSTASEASQRLDLEHVSP